MACGEIAESREPTDQRLLIEASDNGWAYGILGPRNLVCVGVITDVQSVAGRSPQTVARSILDGTSRIARLTTRITRSIVFQAAPVFCRWLPLVAGHKTLRIGDAHASFDPLAGRGLWSAIRSTEQVANALDTRPDNLELLQHSSRVSYNRYLEQRLGHYQAANERFATGFWARRCSRQEIGPSGDAGVAQEAAV